MFATTDRVGRRVSRVHLALRRGLLALSGIAALALGGPAASAAPPAPSNSLPTKVKKATAPPTGAFSLSIEPATKPELVAYPEFVRHTPGVQRVVTILNQLALPRDVPVRFRECGVLNAFYSPRDHNVNLCYELIAYFDKTIKADSSTDPKVADVELRRAMLFSMLHEAGHAVIGELEMGVTGGEEDAVDDFAAVTLINFKAPEAALEGANSFRYLGQLHRHSQPAYFNEHSLSEQRYYNVLCTVFGSDPSAFKGLVPKPLPPARAVRCVDEFTKKKKAWHNMLTDYYKKRPG